MSEGHCACAPGFTGAGCSAAMCECTEPHRPPLRAAWCDVDKHYVAYCGTFPLFSLHDVHM